MTEAEDDLLPEYDLDYRRSKPNRFAALLKLNRHVAEEGIVGQYGQAAVNAVKLYTDKRVLSVPEAWKQATAKILHPKGCPKGAFLGLCEEGLVEGVPKGCYTKSIKNKQYALDAVRILRHSPDLANKPLLLWEQVPHGEVKNHEGQMYVVSSLWNANLIR